MGNARQIAIALSKDGYDISTRNAAIMALEEDFGYSEEEAVNLADAIVEESTNL